MHVIYFLDYMILKLEAIDGPMKLMKKSLEDREATAKYLKDRGWVNKTSKTKKNTN